MKKNNKQLIKLRKELDIAMDERIIEKLSEMIYNENDLVTKANLIVLQLEFIKEQDILKSEIDFLKWFLGRMPYSFYHINISYNDRNIHNLKLIKEMLVWKKQQTYSRKWWV